MKEIIIYAPATGPRLAYACNIVFKTILNCEYRIVNQPEETTHINYSTESLVEAIQIKPSGLLEQTGISSHDVAVGEYKDRKTLFHSGNEGLPFDIFSAVFYMCSRYEEYLPHEPDEHGRFKVEDSVAYANHFVQEPIVEQWVKLLSEKLSVDFPQNSFDFQLTIDIDNAWKYKKYPFYRQMGGILKNLVLFQFTCLGERLAVLSGLKKDPWNTYEYLETLEEQTGRPHQFFILMNSSRPFDGAVSFKRKAFRKLVQSLNKKKPVGIHPSYESHESYDHLSHEFVALSKIVRNKPRLSRQHYLKLSMPGTYQNLIKLGILEDYSMGWCGQMGFRAGISRPFAFYDISKEKETHLRIVPFVYMDRTLKDYMNLTPQEAIKQIADVAEKVKTVGGQFVMLWHNDSISNNGEWLGWRRVLEESFVYCKSD